MTIFDTLRRVARAIEHIANAPVEVREILSEASRRERVAQDERRRNPPGPMFDGPGSLQSFAATAEEVARERGYDLRAWASKVRRKPSSASGDAGEN